MSSHPHANGEADGPARTALLRRAILLVSLLIAEALVASTFLDGGTLIRKGGVLTHLLAVCGDWAVRGIIGFAALFTTFVYLKHRATVLRLAAQTAAAPINLGLLAAHAAAVAVFAELSSALYGAAPVVVPLDLLGGAWLLAALAVVASLGVAVAPWRFWADLIAGTGLLWLQASAASAAACLAGAYSWALWTPATRLTFALVKLSLSPFLSDMVIQPERMRIGTSRFAVIISPQCSGLEGAGLLLVFAIFWMILFRDEIRFPRSLILVPVSVVVLFLLNAARIAALILIGSSGAREIAAGGFHSQAGWIAFNLVAFGLCLAARRLPWFSLHRPSALPVDPAGDNPTAAYLVPFLLILAAGMISQAMSAGFEWFYWLRLAAALPALWILRRGYVSVDWRFSWLGVSIGVAVFTLWIAMEALVSPGQQPAGMPAPLSGASTSVQLAWIALRILGAAVTVPIAEELAFRGFILRRLSSAHFDTLPYRRFTLFAVVISSVLFGLMHGERWIAGTAAGALYALAAIGSGRLGGAVAAHATTNALLACYVLATGKWFLW